MRRLGAISVKGLSTNGGCAHIASGNVAAASEPSVTNSLRLLVLRRNHSDDPDGRNGSTPRGDRLMLRRLYPGTADELCCAAKILRPVLSNEIVGIAIADGRLHPRVGKIGSEQLRLKR